MKLLHEMRVEQEQQQQMEGGASSGQGNQSSTPQLTPQELINTYNQNFPSLLQTTTGQVGNTAQTLAQGAAGANPIYTQAGLQQLQSLAPGYQQAGANLATNQAQTTTGLLNGAGGQAAQAATNLSNNLNPVQATSNAQANNLLNSINLGGLSGGEQAATERSLNQSNYATGNLGLDNATNAVSNAMNFGNALQAKRQALGSALGTAQGVASNQNTFVNPVGTAINAGNTSTNFGLGTFNPTQANNTITAPLTFGSSIFSPTASNASASNSVGAQNNSSWNGGVSCYLTTACCEYKGLPDDCEELTILRKFRDEYVSKELTAEYYRVAPSIVAKIRNSNVWMEYVYDTVKRCVRYIKGGYNSLALEEYKDMVDILKGELCL
jgi:hypothetical protein